MSALTEQWSGFGSTNPVHSRPKLTGAQRDEILRRRAAGERAAALALEFGVTAGHIRSLGVER